MTTVTQCLKLVCAAAAGETQDRAVRLVRREGVDARAERLRDSSRRDRLEWDSYQSVQEEHHE